VEYARHKLKHPYDDSLFEKLARDFFHLADVPAAEPRPKWAKWLTASTLADQGKVQHAQKVLAGVIGK
jgi:hypothetical protein